MEKLSHHGRALEHLQSLGTKIMSCHANKERETEKDLEDKFSFSQPGVFLVCCQFSTIAKDSRDTGRLLELISAETTIISEQ